MVDLNIKLSDVFLVFESFGIKGKGRWGGIYKKRCLIYVYNKK